ncbi:hypothetical protein ACLB2K_056051 [Fragaria x ananassa]
MAFSKTFLLVALAFAVLLISAEVSAHRDLAETTTATQKANTDGYHGHDHGWHGGHGGHGGHHGGHGPHDVETEN